MLTLSREELVARLPKNGNVAEIGVDKGDFSRVILNQSNPKKLILIDPWIEMLDIKDLQSVHQEKYNSVVEMFKGDDRVNILKKSSADALQDVANTSLDWIYIDGDHKYDGCLHDLENYATKVKDDGYICGHDWVTSPKKGFGVNEAVAKFIKDTGFILCGLTNESNFKSYILAKSQSSQKRFNESIK